MLTEENGEIFIPGAEFLEHLVVDLFDLIADLHHIGIS